MPIYDYKCESCEHTTTVMCKYEDLPKEVPCEDCKSNDTYRLYGVGMIKSTYEQNGRIGLRVSGTGDRPIHRSMTRENIERGKGSDSVVTKGYREHMKKTGKA